MSSVAVNSFAELYEFDAIKAMYYSSHVAMTFLSPPLLYRYVKFRNLLSRCQSEACTAQINTENFWAAVMHLLGSN